MIRCILCGSVNISETTFDPKQEMGFVHICRDCGTSHEHLPIRYQDTGDIFRGMSGEIVFYDYTRPGKIKK